MPSPENIAKNTTYLTVALVVQKILSFFFFLFIAKTLGNGGTGEYVAAFSLSSIFGVFADFGLGPVLIRELAHDESKSVIYLGNIIAIKLWLSVIAFGALVGTVYAVRLLGGGHPPLALIIVAGAVMIVDSFALTGTSVFRGRQNLWFESIVVILNKVLILGLGLVALYLWPSALNVALTILAGSIVSFFALTYFLNRELHLSWRPRLNKIVILELKKLALPFALANIFAAVYAYSDSVLLSFLKGSQAVGIYSVAAKTMNAFQFIPMAFMAAVFPAMSYYHRHAPERLRDIFEQSFRYLLLISAPLAIGLFVLADQFVAQLGADYWPAALAVRILVPSLVFVFLSFPLGALLNAANRQHWQTAVIGLSMIINIGLNIWLIPALSYIGASWSWFITNAAVLLIGLWLARLVVAYRIWPLVKSLGRVLVSVAVMGWATLAMTAFMPLLLVVLLSGIIYTAGLFALRELSLADVQYFWGLFHRREAELITVSSSE
ncbi:hypothetical protein A3I40_03585 [Candidatus Uhrbacteria bacterium RIFCSPLOWO2_02_FULL_48_12]|uniref:Uncharacterized protein n=1 Tax=Candidatus Uhrbacteria bacterium RIFCSPLOWO2_02_FULL_48_12 TaxID=1802407 RepID=A0A1F7V9V7_9BACT|nr:MAG: hypothetical protein A3I40_03585 [Candidatus Uhrbacteria bacterium RIFCSPLOWO2_02_FULL_48_12]